MITHTEVKKLVLEWIQPKEYTRIRVFNCGWIPDLTFSSANNEMFAYEIKPEPLGRGEIRSGLIQCLEGYINGFRSYLVVHNNYLPIINKFLPQLPQIGIITYSTDRKLEIVKESEEPPKLAEGVEIKQYLGPKRPKPEGRPLVMFYYCKYCHRDHRRGSEAFTNHYVPKSTRR